MQHGCKRTGNQSPADKTTYVVPFFATDKTAVQSEARGITHMPTGGPWGDESMRSASVMQSLPAMIGFESIEKDSFENVKTEADEKGKPENGRKMMTVFTSAIQSSMKTRTWESLNTTTMTLKMFSPTVRWSC